MSNPASSHSFPAWPAWTDIGAKDGEQRRFVPKAGGWTAQWIWLSDAAFPDCQACRRTLFCPDEFPYTLALFRKVVDLPFAPERAVAWISADTKYRCAINGRVVSRGPAEVGGDYGNMESPDWWFYDGIEVSLRRGRNVITAEVVLGPVVQADYSMGCGGFLLELLVQGRGGESLVIGTDDSWKGTRCAAAVSPAAYDARREVPGFNASAFDDRAWPRARVLGQVKDCRWNLMPREIPPLQVTRVPPVEIVFSREAFRKRCRGLSALLRAEGPCALEPGEPMDFLLRFPRELTGYLYLDLAGPSGARLDADFRELPQAAGKSAESFILPGGRWTHETRRLQGFEWVHVTVSFPEGKAAPLEIHALDAIFTSFPLAAAGSFECSDPFLNRLWEAGRWTTRLCMQSYHLDSPIHQEGLGCTGDYMIEALISYRCFGEARLARKDILRTACLLRQKKSRMFHTSYSLLWIWMLMDYWRFSGDAETVRQVMPDVHHLLELFASYKGATGLITEAPNYMFMDWVHVGDFNLHHPPASMGQGYMNAFYYRALRYAAELSRNCGDEGRGTACDRSAEDLKRAFHQHLWDDRRGLYRDGIPGATKIAPSRWLPADSPKASFTVHTNALAVAVGIAEPERREAIMRRVMADASLPIVQPYFMHFVFEALAEAGLFEEHGFAEINRWRAILDEHPSSLKETWHGGDYSHAWSGTPTYQLSTRVLGVSGRGAGFRAVALRPFLGPLPWAKGIVPTPQGPLEVSWQKDNAALAGTLAGPPGCEVTLVLEKAESATIWQGGRRIRPAQTPEGNLTWTLTDKKCRIHI